MKSLLRSFAFGAACFGLCAVLSAQTFEFIGVIKSIEYRQSDASTAVPDPFGDGPGQEALPFGIDFFVAGENVGGITAPVVSGPFVVQENTPGYPDAAYFNGGTLVYSSDDDGWSFGFPDGENWGATSKAALDAAFPNGTYSITMEGATFDLALGTDTYPETPIITLSGGEWSNGRYLIPFDAELVISTTYSGYGTHAIDAISILVDSYTDETFERIDDFFLSTENPEKGTYSITIPANTLVAGKSYDVEAGATAIIDLQSNEAVGEAIIVAGYEKFTFLNLVATPLPEPPDTGPIETSIGPAHVVKFQTIDGIRYDLEGSDDMENWFIMIPQIPGDGSLQSFFFEYGGPARYYRAVPVAPF